jgi:hypothetical protein
MDTSGSLFATSDSNSSYCLYVLQGLCPTSMLQFACRVNFGVRISYVLGARVVSQYVPEHRIEQILVRDIVCDIPRFEHVNNYK